MAHFILNKDMQESGDHEVHNETKGCNYLPSPTKRIELGYHLNCYDAVSEARRRRPSYKINGCYFCCNECNTG